MLPLPPLPLLLLLPLILLTSPSLSLKTSTLDLSLGASSLDFVCPKCNDQLVKYRQEFARLQSRLRASQLALRARGGGWTATGSS